MIIEKLQERVRKNGFDYKLVARSDKAAMYEQLEENGEPTDHWEVFNIITTPYRSEMRKFYTRMKREFKEENFAEYKEHFPTDNDFGYTAWTFTDFDEAKEKFKSLAG